MKFICVYETVCPCLPHLCVHQFLHQRFILQHTGIEQSAYHFVGLLRIVDIFEVDGGDSAMIAGLSGPDFVDGVFMA